MKVQTYLFFEGRGEEALEFYKKELGAQVTSVMRFKDMPPAGKPESVPKSADCAPAAGTENKIMHAEFKIGDTTLMASDGRCSGRSKFEGFSIALSVKTDQEAEQFFGALAMGGQVQMPMVETFFASKFGMVSDKFGVSWMILAEKPIT